MIQHKIMVRSSKAGEQAIDKLVQLLRSTLCVFMLVGSASTFAGQNILYYLSQPGDWIGQGQEVRFTGADGSFSSPPTIPNFAGVVVKHLTECNGLASTSALPTAQASSPVPMKTPYEQDLRGLGVQASIFPRTDAAVLE